MKVEQCKNFISLLDAASITPGVYLSQASDSTFKLVSSRDSKNLNTDQIAAIAERCFAMQTTDLGKLVTALKNYQARVYASKPWHYRIAFFFGYKSSGEKRINKLAKFDFKPRSILKHDDKEQLKLFYHKVLDSKTRREELNGNSFYRSISSVLNDLIQYMASVSHISQAHIHLVEDVQFALSLEDLKFELPTRSMFKQRAKRIVQRVNELPEKTEDIRHAVIIPGGCRKHAVLYVIERSTTGSFSFKIVNTGQGATNSMPMIDESGHVYLPQKHAVIDIQYTGLTSEHLSESFFNTLMQFKTTKEMPEVNAYIEKQLLKANPSNFRIGREHKAQHNGTCSIKCLMAYIRDRLGQEEYRKFKLWMTDREIARFEEVITQNSTKFSKEELAEMKREAEEVRAKRAQKVTLFP